MPTHEPKPQKVYRRLTEEEYQSQAEELQGAIAKAETKLLQEQSWLQHVEDNAARAIAQQKVNANVAAIMLKNAKSKLEQLAEQQKSELLIA